MSKPLIYFFNNFIINYPILTKFTVNISALLVNVFTTNELSRTWIRLGTGFLAIFV